MIFTLIKNELIKILRRGKTWIVFGLFALFIVGMTFVANANAKDMAFYNSTEGQIENYNDCIDSEKDYIESLKQDGTADPQTIAESEELIKGYEEEISRLQTIVDTKDNPDYWKDELKNEKEEIQKSLKEDNLSEQDKEYNENRLKMIDEYLDKDIEPIEDWEFNGVNYLLQFIRAIGTIILVCGIAVFMSDIVSGECTPPTLKFLLVQPISRGKVLLSKFIAVTLSVVTFIGGLELIVFGVVSAITGMDAAKMPTLVGTQYTLDYSTMASQGSPTLKEVAGSASIISKGEFLAQSFALQLLFIVACCAVIFMISSIFKSSMVTMAISVIFTVATTAVCGLSSKIAKIAHLIFLNYGDPTSVITGDIAYNFYNPHFSVVTGIIVMLVTSVIAYLIGYVVFKKKDILI